MPFDHVLRSEADLRAIFRPPGAGAVRKQIDHLDAHCRDFLAHCPFAVIATADAAGRCDASPKGGPPGFIRVLDDHRLAMADLSGNNRLDSMQNLVANPGIALWCTIPGLDETLRINGRASLTTDQAVLAACALDGIVPRVALGVDVAEAYIHCAKALRRGGLWHADQWPDTAGMASIPEMLRDHACLDVTPEVITAALDADYDQTLWQAGGAGATAAGR